MRKGIFFLVRWFFFFFWLYLYCFTLKGQGLLSDGWLCDRPHRDFAGSQCSVPIPGLLWRGSGAALQDAQTKGGHAGADLQRYFFKDTVMSFLMKFSWGRTEANDQLADLTFLSFSVDLNAQYYLMIRRQLMFELAETYNEMMDLKLALANRQADTQSLDNHTIKKFNHLCSASAK